VPEIEARTSVPVVLILDDDIEVGTAIAELMRAEGFESTSFATIGELLASPLFERANCLILDVQMPHMSGLEVQERLIAAGFAKPIVFLTGYGDVEQSVRAMKAGAIDFLTKPAAETVLLGAVKAGVARDISLREDNRVIRQNMERFAALTPRETEVLHAVVEGRLNKQIAHQLGIAEITVKLHRSNLMKKMGAASIAELIRAWESLPIELRTARSGQLRDRLHSNGACALMLKHGPSGKILDE